MEVHKKVKKRNIKNKNDIFDSQAVLSQLAKNISKYSVHPIEMKDIIEVITFVSKIHMNKKFGYFEAEDIQGEVWIICLNQINQYNFTITDKYYPMKHLEKWLNRVVKNRLMNFYRDRYSSVNEKLKISRFNIIHHLPLDVVDVEREKNFCSFNESKIDNLIFQEFYDYLTDNLNDEFLSIFLDMLSDENVSSYYRVKLREQVESLYSQWLEKHKENGRTK